MRIFSRVLVLAIALVAVVTAVTVINEEAEWARSLIPHPIDVPIAESLPRISVEELKLPENADYKDRVKPFILTGAMDDWPAMTKWQINAQESSYLEKRFAREVSDFYPYNMLESGTHPFLFRFGAGVREIMNPSGRFEDTQERRWACPEIGGCKYIHMQLTPKTWSELEKTGDIPAKRHYHLEGDRWWMRRCLADPDVQEEYHLKTHWKIILIGSRGSGMFNHSDSLMTSSWHGHVQGKKWWYVCSPDGHRPQKCYESIMKPGEVLYYGAGWYHATRNLEYPSMTVTGTVVHKENFEGIADKLHSECYRKSMGFMFSSKLCDSLDKCYPLWHKYLKGQDPPQSRWRPWRELATSELIEERERTDPKANNYDGRNYIGE